MAKWSHLDIYQIHLDEDTRRRISQEQLIAGCCHTGFCQLSRKQFCVQLTRRPSWIVIGTKLVFEAGHQVDLSKVSVIAYHPHTQTHCLLESWHIQHHLVPLNREKGLMPGLHATLLD